MFRPSIFVGVLLGSLAVVPRLEAAVPLPFGEIAAMQHANVLVSQLASSKFGQRERAARELIEMGLPALSLVRASLDSPDREVRLRCRHIFASISRQDRPRRLAMLLSGQPVDHMSQQFDLELPGWEALRELAGDHEQSRRFMGFVLKTEWDFLEQTTRGEAESWVLISRRCAELRRLGSGKRRTQQHAPAIAAILIATVVRDHSLPENTAIQLYSLLQQVGHSKSAKGISTWQDETFRKLVGRFIATAHGPTATYQCLSIALQHNLPEGLLAAERVVDNTAALPHVRQFAILAIARFGNEAHQDRLQELLGNSHVFYSRANQKNAPNTFECQVRDLALASLIHLAGKDPREFGFASLQLSRQFVFQPQTVGFKTEADRQTAFDRWQEAGGW